MDNLIKISNLLNEIGIDKKINSEKDLLSFIRRINEILIRETHLDIYEVLLKKIDESFEIFIEIFGIFHDFLKTYNEKRSANDLMNELSYALWSHLKYFYEIDNKEFLKFIKHQTIQLNIDADNPELAMLKYVELISYFSPKSSKDFSKIFNLEDILIELDLYWKRNLTNSKWAHYSYFFIQDEFYFDNAGALGNLAYFRWSLRKDLKKFADFKSEFNFILNEINELILHDAPTIATYFFIEFFYICKYNRDIESEPQNYKLLLLQIKRLAEIIEKKYPNHFIALSKFYRESAIILLNLEHFFKLNIYWVEFLKSTYKRENSHGKYIFTKHHLEKLYEHNKSLNKFLDKIKAEKYTKIIKKAQRCCWNLIKFYRRNKLESWAIIMVMQIEHLKQKKRKKYLINNRSIIFERTISEKKSRIDKKLEGVEYLLEKDDLLFDLDRYIVNNILPNKQKIFFLKSKIEELLKRFEDPFLLREYYDFLIDISIREMDYELLNNTINLVLQKSEYFHLQNKERLYYHLIKYQLEIGNNPTVRLINNVKEKIEIVLNKIYEGVDTLIQIQKTEIRNTKDLIILYFDVLIEILKIISFLEEWNEEINKGILIISSEWQEKKQKYYLYIFILEFVIINSSKSQFFIKKLFTLKETYTLLFKLGIHLENSVIDQKNPILISEFKKLYRTFSRDNYIFSNFFNYYNNRSKAKSKLLNIQIKPFVIDPKRIIKSDIDEEVKLIEKIVDPSGGFLLLKFSTSKKKVYELIKYPFLTHPPEDVESLIIKNIQFGIVWLDGKLPLRTKQIKLDKLEIVDEFYYIDINIDIRERNTNIFFITPFLENSVFSKKIYGNREYIEISSLIRERVESSNLTKPMIKIIARNGIPILKEESYLLILESINNFAIAIERLPGTFRFLNENQIRDFILVLLNIDCKGRATGETFNKKGKTDLLIRYNNQNLFIGECKFWKGSEKFKETIKQLFKYITWRDTKVAIIFFNRNKKFSDVLKKIDLTIKEQPLFNRENNDIKAHFCNNESLFGYIFKHPSDDGQEVYLTVLAFDIR